MINLALDCDGVLRSFTKQVSKVAKDEFGLDVTDNPTEWSYLFKIKAGDTVLGNHIMGDLAGEVFGKAPVIEGARKAYERFITNDRINVYIVTTQPEGKEQHTLDWLEENGFTHYQDVLFLKDKTEAPCNTIIDDKPSNVQSYIDKARMGYIIDRPYNRDFKRGRRMKDLNETYENLIQFL